MSFRAEDKQIQKASKCGRNFEDFIMQSLHQLAYNELHDPLPE